MGDLLIRDIPEALKAELEQVAKRAGRSLSATSIDLLRHSLLDKREKQKEPFVSAWDVLRPTLYHGGDAEQRDFVEIMEEVEAARKRDFGKPSADLE